MGFLEMNKIQRMLIYQTSKENFLMEMSCVVISLINANTAHYVGTKMSSHLEAESQFMPVAPTSGERANVNRKLPAT